MSETNTAPVLLTVEQFAAKHSWARVGGLRHALFFRESNGFDVCVVRFGRKLLLDEAQVFSWLREKGGDLAGPSRRALS
jgi:hypothetical protein